MNRTTFYKFLLICMIIQPAYSADPSGLEIMKKNEEARKLNQVTASATLIVTPISGPEKTKSFTWWKKIKKNLIHYQTLTRFHTPAEIKGQGILFQEQENGNNDIQLYLPTYKKVRRVENAQQSGSFMGSDFSYSDIATPHLSDYNFKNIKTEKCPNLENTQCYLIEATPANLSVQSRTGYKKTISWVRQDNFMLTRSKYFDENDDQIKQLEILENQLVNNTKWMATNLSMTQLKSGRKTTLKFEKIKTNEELKDYLFTVQNLQKD